MGYARYWAPLMGTKKVLGYDSDEELISVWRWIRNASPEELLKTPQPSIEGEDIRELCSAAGYPHAAAVWIRMNQRVGRNTNWGASIWGSPVLRYEDFLKKGIEQERVIGWLNNGMWGEQFKIRTLAHRFKWETWKFFARDYRDIPNIEATWFIDPPYQHQGKIYQGGSSEDIDYQELADWCKSRKGQVIVCEDSQADWLPFEDFGRNTTRTQAKKPGARHREVIWTK